MARPIPRPPPVTSATWPLRREDRAIDGSFMMVRPCDGQHDSMGEQRTKLISILLACLALGSLLAKHLDPLEREFQTFAAELGTRDYVLNVGEQVRVSHFLPQVLEKGMNLRQQKIHFAAHCRLEEHFFIEHALERERRCHAPVAANLAEPIVLLPAQVADNFHEVFGTLGPELGEPPVSRFAHFRFAAEIVEFKNQFSISGGGLFRHLATSKWILKLGK